MLGNAAVHIGDCTAVPAGTDSSRVKHGIASELHAQR